MGRWMFPALPLTRSAEIFLLPIGSTTIVDQPITAAVGTMNRDRYHVTFLLSNDSCSSLYHIIPFLATTCKITFFTFTFAGYQPIVLRYLFTLHAQEYAALAEKIAVDSVALSRTLLTVTV
jgi:hypothetical protein